MHDRHPAGDHPDEVHVVLDDDHGGDLVEPLEQADRLLHLFRRHARRRLVEEDQGRLADARHADLQPLLLPVREPRRGMLGPLGEPDDLQHLGRPPPAFTVPEPELGGEVKVVPHAELLENAGHLELDTHPEPGDPESIPAGDVTALEADGAGAGAHRAAQHRKKVDLPAPFGPIKPPSSTASTVQSKWTARTPPKHLISYPTSRI